MSHKLGMHWLRYHQDGRDFEHVERMQYKSVKPFEWMWNNRDFCANLLATLPSDSYILARDHPLSEQKADMWHDPIGTGARHANEWAHKVASGNYHLPVDRTFFTGINEPDATNGDRSAIDRYNVALLDRLAAHGLRGGAFGFSTGHPRTVDGTPYTPADYTVFEGSRQAIVRGNHIAIAHIYGTAAVPLAPGHYDRLAACPWTDVEWVIGEFGVDEHVIGGGPHIGFHGGFEGRLHEYCGWIDRAIMGIEDIFPYIHDYELYTFDYSHPWGSFDVRAIREALESYDWQHGKPATKPVTTHIPVVMQPTPEQPAPPVKPPTEVQPMATGIIDPRVAEAILQIESNNSGFANGRLKIRIEAHLLLDARFGNPAVFAPYFRCESGNYIDGWYRFNPHGEWVHYHNQGQNGEWAAFEFARKLDEGAALRCMSMGASQVMGFNCVRIGYGTPKAMFNAFSRSENAHIIAFFNYCLGEPNLMNAIHNKDWETIAAHYNSTGNVLHYSKLLKKAYEALA